MHFSDEQVRDILQLKDTTVQKIERYQKEIRTLEKQLEILDSIVRQSSFTKASSIQHLTAQDPHAEESGVRESSADRQDGDDSTESIPITQGNQGQVIANAHVTPQQVSIILDESLNIDDSVPPFKTFFLERIIGEMRKKDDVDVGRGTIPSESVIDYTINKEGTSMREIVIRNYRQKERVKEIISTAGWSLNRMLENTR